MGTGSKCAESGCALAKIGGGFTQPEIGPRYQSTRLLVVGDVGGEPEMRESLPFRPYSQGGALLIDAMNQVNVGRGEVAMMDIVRCRPPKDYLVGSPYQYNAISNCITNYLYSVIEELKPKAILALGGIALKALTPGVKGKYGMLDYLRGYVQMGEGPAKGIPVIGSYHPRDIRRGSPELMPLLHRDVKRAYLAAVGKLVEGRDYILNPMDAGLNYQCSPTIDEAWDFVDKLNPDLPLAFDIETPLSTRSDEDEKTSFTNRDINLFQATQRRGQGIAIPFRDEYRSVVKAILERSAIKVGFNNWNYDNPVLLGNGIDVGRTDDAMNLFGYYWSDLSRNLQSAAQTCGFQFPWKHLNDSDLAFYGCADVDATLCVFNHMTKVLAGEQI